MRLPAGTITFFFTDIDGSTRFWEDCPDVMSVALRRHDQLLRSVVEEHGGLVFKTVGDAFHVAFEDASTALSAATQAQIALNSERWPATTPIRVRMVLHTGEAEMRDSDYFGRTLNRTARILAAGHGGQILLSQTVRDQLTDELPPGIDLVDLGEHRIRDLVETERLYQVIHPALPDRFDPIQTLETVGIPNNLPQPATSFIGRESEIAAVRGMLSEARLVTLVGAGGSGKTRLSQEVSAGLLGEYRDGVWFVALAPIESPELVASAFASALQIEEAPGRPILDGVIAGLRGKTVLIVVDNCEHVIEQAARVVERLSQSCPTARFLCTSREPLNIAGERAYRIPPLSLPDLDRGRDGFADKESVRLFLERAKSARPDVAEREVIPIVASICVRLDGMPLAIELAAARCRSLSVPEIHNRLDDMFSLLTGGSRTALPRQQTLRALIDWSFDLLNEQERDAFKALSIFAGGWSLSAAEYLLADRDPSDSFYAIDVISALVDKSLVTVKTVDGASRYEMLATIRSYARERLASAGELRAAQIRHRDYFIGLVSDGYSKTRGQDAPQWLATYDRELENLRSATSFSFADGDATSALWLTGELGWFWYSRSYTSEGRTLLDRALAMPGGEAPTSQRMRAHYSSFWLAHTSDDVTAAKRQAQCLLKAAADANDPRFLTLAWNGAGLIARFHEEDYPAAKHNFIEALRISRSMEDGGIARAILTNLASTVTCLGDYEGARNYLSEALEIATVRQEAEGMAICAFELATVFFEMTEYEQARPHFATALHIVTGLGLKARHLDTLNWMNLMAVDCEQFETAALGFRQALSLARELKSEYRASWSSAGLGRALAGLGDFAKARGFLDAAASYYVQKSDLFGISDTLYGYAKIASGADAAAILGAAWAHRRRHPQAVSPNDRRRFSLMADKVRSEIGDSAFDTFVQAGEAWSTDEALSRARQF